MNIYEFAPIKALITAAAWLVNGISDLLAPIAGASSAALAVIALTLLVRVILIPVGISQVRASLTRERLAPRIAELRKRYSKNPELLQRKTMELYSAERASPFAGCLPVLAQMPVLMSVYGLFILPEIAGSPNELLGHAFLGIPLGSSFVGMLTGGAAGTAALMLPHALVHIGIILVIAVVAQASRRLLAPQQPAQPTPPMPTAPGQGQRPGDPAMPDLSGMMRAMSFLPFMTAVIAAFVPLAAALYLMTTTAWTFGERWVLNAILRKGHTPRR
ncbi:YidC/Oxa1 family membrane protein insertase [Leucobacter sp. GX24907]